MKDNDINAKRGNMSTIHTYKNMTKKLYDQKIKLMIVVRVNVVALSVIADKRRRLSLARGENLARRSVGAFSRPHQAKSQFSICRLYTRFCARHCAEGR